MFPCNCRTTGLPKMHCVVLSTWTLPRLTSLAVQLRFPPKRSAGLSRDGNVPTVTQLCIAASTVTLVSVPRLAGRGVNAAGEPRHAGFLVSGSPPAGGAGAGENTPSHALLGPVGNARFGPGAGRARPVLGPPR